MQLLSKELLQALKTLVDQNVGDYVYDVRERELEGWEGPKVKAWSDACEVIKKIVKEAEAL